MRPAARPRHAGHRVTAALAAPLVLLATMGCNPTPGSLDDATPGSEAPTLELAAQIGCADCRDQRQITPTVVAQFDNGRIAVLDRYEPFVRIFSADGNPERAFGTMGQGPGELGTRGEEFFPGMFLVPGSDGGISVVESMPVVLETFDGAGNFLGQRDLRLPVGVPYSQAYSPATRSYFRYEAIPLADEAGDIKRCRLDDIDAGAACVDFVSAADLIAPRPEDAPRPSISIAAAPDGSLVVADEGTYRLWVVDDRGEVIVSTAREVARAPKSAAELERDREIHQRVRRLRDEPIDPLRGHITHAGVQVDGRGRIWVLTERHVGFESTFDVFASDGAFLAEIAVPTAIRASRVGVTPIMSIVGDRIAAITQQPDGSEQVWVWRITDGGSP